MLPNKQQLHFIAIGTGKIQEEEVLTNLLRKGL